MLNDEKNLDQQTARGLVKNYGKIGHSSSTNLQKHRQDLLCISGFVENFEAVAKGQVREAVEALDRRKGAGMRPEDAWNSTSVELASAAMASIRHYVVKTNAEALTRQYSSAVLGILTDLFYLLCYSWVQQHFGDFMRHTDIKVYREVMVLCNDINQNDEISGTPFD